MSGDEVRWTDEQTRALLAEGHTLLSASAGTGKTRTIVGKMAWLLGLEVEPRADGHVIARCPAPCRLDEIVAVTFTEKAACELKERLRRRIVSSDRPELQWELDRASIGTIHAFCAGLLRDHALRFGIDPRFRVLDERESALRLHEVVRDEVLEAVRAGGDEIGPLLERFGLRGERGGPGLVGAVTSVVRDVRWQGGATPGDAGPTAEPTDAGAVALAAGLHRLARRVDAAWSARMETENFRDFDSLILDARRLLTDPGHRPALLAIRRRLRALIIDEFQDTDAAQRDIAFALAGIDDEAGPAPWLLLVGDPKQSIYSFRGADIAVWNDARRRLCGGGRPLELTSNFRAQPGVVEFVNRVASAAVEATGAPLDSLDPDLRIEYSPLKPHRAAGPGQGVDWLDCTVEGGPREAAVLEARLVLARVRALLAGGRLPDPTDPEGLRPVRASDIAVLARTRRGLERVDRALREAGIPTHNAAGLGLSERAEVRDLVTVLRLLVDPADDLHALALLRSPFVGLRDEVIARCRLDPGAPGGPLLRQAAGYLRRVVKGEAEWFEAPEHPAIGGVEREALTRALAALAEGHALVDRVPASELLEDVVRRTGYRLHLALRPAEGEATAAIERFLALLDEYRRLPAASFLEVWDRWGDRDPGLPRGPLHGVGGDAVTLLTIHAAKGLEWPIVLLLQAGEGFRDRLTDRCLTDRRLGPALIPNQAERGALTTAIAERALAAERAEEARLLYVALTRARDRLVVASPDVERGYMEFIRPALEGATLPHLAPPDPPPLDRRRPSRAPAEDPATRTGRQIEVFPEDAAGQLDMFRHTPPSSGTAGESVTAPVLLPVVHRAVDPEQKTIEAIPVSLDWLDGLRAGEAPPLVRRLETPTIRPITSATERQLRATDRRAWRLRYLHGVEEVWRFAPRTDGDPSIPATLRGTLIHGVLERIRAADELSRLLDETIARVDAPPGSDELLERGAPYRAALEAEIERVVTGERWRGYVAGVHHRELPFLVLAGGPPWPAGSIDLFRPGDIPRIIDFKTHRIAADAAPEVAGGYEIQAKVYRDAVSALTGSTPRVTLHFTNPDTTVDL